MTGINKYKLISNSIMSLIDYKGKIIYFSPDKYERIKNFSWSIGKSDYGYGKIKENEKIKIVLFHRYLLNVHNDESIIVDHIDRNRLDNRNDNLRLVNRQFNNINSGKRFDNTSGIVGISQTEDGTWHFYLNYNGKRYGKIVKSKEEAIINRLKLELKYFKNFAPQKHLFEEYGIR